MTTKRSGDDIVWNTDTKVECTLSSEEYEQIRARMHEMLISMTIGMSQLSRALLIMFAAGEIELNMVEILELAPKSEHTIKKEK